MASWKKVIVSGSAAELSSLSLTTALTVPNGGTGITSVASNGILYGNGTGALQVASAAANSVLITNGSNVPSLSATLPTAVQGNITTVGTIGTGVWQGTAIADTYVANNLTIDGGTVNNTVIGGSTPAAATFTTGKFTSGIEVTGSFISIDATASFENLGVSERITIGNDGRIEEVGSTLNVGTNARGLTTDNASQTTTLGTFSSPQITIIEAPFAAVGIDQASPSYTLDVNGTASFAGITMGTGGNVNGIGSNITFTGANSSLTGSFSGSFSGDGTGLTGVTADFPVTVKGAGLVATDLFFFNDNNGAQPCKQLALGTLVTDIAGGGLTVVGGKNLAVDSGSLVAYYTGSTFSTISGDITINSGGVSAIGSGVIVNADVNASAAIAYTKLDFAGSGHVSSSAFSAPSQGTVRAVINGVQTDVDTGLQASDNPTFAGVTAGNVQVGVTGDNEIDTSTGNLTIDSAGGTTIIDDLLSVTGIATFQSDIIVRGTASFENTTNLEVADRFILLASGSTSAGDGGIVIQQTATKTGAVFAYDGASTGRWGIDTAFDATASAYTPAAFMGAVVDIDAGQSDIAAYQKNGNIKVDGGDIYIYS